MTATAQQTGSLLTAGVIDGWRLGPALLGTGQGITAGQPHERMDSAKVEPLRLGDPGPCPPGGATVFIVLDGSASVAGCGGNDPLSRRHSEAALAIRHVARACRCGRDRVALVPFDIASTGHVGPQPLTERGVRRLHHGLRQLSDECGLSSELGPALEVIEAQTGAASGAVALVVFSDFLLTDSNPSAVLSRLHAFPGSVHAVVLGGQPPGVLLADPAVAVTRLTPSSPPGSAARAVFDGLTHYRIRHRFHQGSAAHHSSDTAEGSNNL
ncbi:VWA domain-containing protein [Mycobacteroides abscessus]|uniref:vWA domain-containing protein n=1 Tax=Mycobacteroides abscessus TaxID=36809 RepID=UPI0021020A5D|nr:vWA domain-containing protein [Mycobacteroides abscessus]MDM2096417.1 VWA domain-containing protein [Mycobacteroides abscessus]MDM2121148.1 VWA domain-containing protein [Mycobacteroides abscessus]MDM2124357.1 VWA domain-containing protein [Mycobacteroides abscessus]MDM2130542.1 VWA domain-containing protein [Mycobacteroides abscessus]MDM2203069.1 VWA domain-containing protein [Mycobacteroides abscessus]